MRVFAQTVTYKSIKSHDQHHVRQIWLEKGQYMWSDYGKTDQVVTFGISTNTDFKYSSHCSPLVLDCSHTRYMWPDLPKGVLYTHSFKTHFSSPSVSYISAPTAYVFYYCWKLNSLLSLRPFSQACLASTSARVAFKWPHLPLASRQPAVNHHTTGWWVWSWI